MLFGEVPWRRGAGARAFLQLWVVSGPSVSAASSPGCSRAPKRCFAVLWGITSCRRAQVGRDVPEQSFPATLVLLLSECCGRDAALPLAGFLCGLQFGWKFTSYYHHRLWCRDALGAAPASSECVLPLQFSLCCETSEEGVSNSRSAALRSCGRAPPLPASGIDSGPPARQSSPRNLNYYPPPDGVIIR